MTIINRLKKGALIYIAIGVLVGSMPELSSALGWAAPVTIGLFSSDPADQLAGSFLRMLLTVGFYLGLFLAGRALWRRRGTSRR